MLVIISNKSIVPLKEESVHTVQILEFVLMDLVFHQRINVYSGFYSILNFTHTHAHTHMVSAFNIFVA